MPSEVGDNVYDEAWLTMFIGHKYLYERGVLHRDISPGNILIKWRPGSEVDQPSTSGCLIDLDHAKKGKAFSSQVTQPVGDDLDPIIQQWCSTNRVELEVARRALPLFPMKRNIGPTMTYMDNVLEHASTFRPFTEGPCTLQHLRWKPVRLYRALFLLL